MGRGSAARTVNEKGRLRRPCWPAAGRAAVGRNGPALRLLDLLQHLEDALRRADEHALEGLGEATTLECVAAGAVSFGHGGFLERCGKAVRGASTAKGR